MIELQFDSPEEELQWERMRRSSAEQKLRETEFFLYGMTIVALIAVGAFAFLRLKGSGPVGHWHWWYLAGIPLVFAFGVMIPTYLAAMLIAHVLRSIAEWWERQ